MKNKSVTLITEEKYIKKLQAFFLNYHYKTFKRAEILLSSSQIPQGVFFLKKGFVRQYIVSSEGKELTIHIYKPGSAFPVLWSLNQYPVEYNLEALNNVVVHIAPVTEFVELLLSDAQLTLALSQRLTAGIKGLTKRIELVSLENANTRVKAALEYLARLFGKINGQDIKINLMFTHQDIAALTGLTRERVSIEMKKLKASGAITYTRGSITILHS